MLLGVLVPLNAGAVDVFDEVCQKEPGSTVCKEKNAQVAAEGASEAKGNPIFGPNGFLTFIINLMSALIGIAAVIMIIMGGLKFITSGSNPQDVNSAREMVIYAVVGVLIAVSAQLIVRLFLNKIGT